MKTFGERLNNLRKQHDLTVYQLAKRAGVHQSLISGLQTNNRVVGEHNARKIGKALQLEGEALESFVYQAINNCTEKVLNEFKSYPAEVLNLIAGILASTGIMPSSIKSCVRKPNEIAADAALYLEDGKAALINVEVAYR